MFLVVTRTFPPEVGGMQNLMWGLAKSLAKIDLIKVFADYSENHEEFDNKVHMFGYHRDNKLIGVIGAQEVKDVILIRHAYTLTSYQQKGIGSALLKYLLKRNQNSRLLVGTWRDAKWAIRFYEKFGFIIHAKEESDSLLEKYWNIPANQIENSVVLERY